MCHNWPRMFSACRKQCPVLPSFTMFIIITGVVTSHTTRVPLVEQGLPTLQEHTSPLQIFSAVYVARSLIFCFVDLCLYIIWKKAKIVVRKNLWIQNINWWSYIKSSDILYAFLCIIQCLLCFYFNNEEGV